MYNHECDQSWAPQSIDSDSKQYVGVAPSYCDINKLCISDAIISKVKSV